MDRWSEAGAIAAGTEPRSRRAAVYQDRPAPPPPDGRAFLWPDPAFPAARAPRGPFHQQQVRSLRRHARAAALAVFAVLALALPAAAQSVTTLVSNAGQSTSKYPPAKPGALVVSRSKRHDVTATRSLAPPKGGYSSNRSCSSRRSSRSCCWMYSRTTRSSCPTVET